MENVMIKMEKKQTNLDEAVTIVTDYLSKEQGKKDRQELKENPIIKSIRWRKVGLQRCKSCI